MLLYKTECPHCGNDITVSDKRKVHKCCWCRRLVGANFTKVGKKTRCEVEALDFPENTKVERTNFNERF